jgi:hypothetical protein
MKKEIKIILEPDVHKSKNGSVFEELVRHILEKQQYIIRPNVLITGLEVDLFAEHTMKKEVLYAECKAKEKPKSTEIKNFVFSLDYGVNGDKADYGFFIHTEELDSHASGLMLQLEKDKPNVSFIGPDKILQSLVHSNIVTSFQLTEIDGFIISKLTLAYSYLGIYYIALLSDGSISKYFTVLDKNLTPVSDANIIDKLKHSLKDIHGLDYWQITSSKEATCKKDIPHINEKDTISEIKESENWFDYTPASIKHFIGRTNLKREIKVFIDTVRKQQTNNRVFLIDGKSGWGKSSLLAELKGSSHTLKYWKSRMHVLAVDTRSANTVNFIGLAFKKLVTSAIESGFLEKGIFTKKLHIISPFNVLDDDSVSELFKELRRRKKVLVLVFDQFEDKFRNEELFDAFYQFCIDVNDLKENLVVGFSWKSEINVPFGNKASNKFHQLRDYAKCITVPEFNQNDAKQVVQQLEKSIGKSIGNDLERRLIESSQGYPWLIKKLCIHTLKQYKAGKTIEELLEQELNYQELFENDLLGIEKEEKRLLDHIATRAYNGSPFDISELDEVTQELVDLLIHKRLVIRTGTTYNIYWDIFRDYLVTNEIPVIGESYLIRQSGNTCLDVFLSFQKRKELHLHELIESYPKTISENSILNILTELRSIGLIKKQKGADTFKITEKVNEVSKDFFKKYITKRFENYTPYIELMKLEKSSIDTNDIKVVLETIFKTEKFEDTTWHTYAKHLAIWFHLSDLAIKDKLVESRKGRSGVIINKENSVPYYSPASLFDTYNSYSPSAEINSRKLRDLYLFDLLDDKDKLIQPTIELEKYVLEKALKLDKVNEAYTHLKHNKSISQAQLLLDKPHIVENYKPITSQKQTMSIIYSWAKFCLLIASGKTFKARSRRRSSDVYYYAFGPSQVLQTISDFSTNTLNLDANNKRKLRDLEYIGLLSFNEGEYSLNSNGMELLASSNKPLILSKFAEKDLNITRFKKYYKSQSFSRT